MREIQFIFKRVVQSFYYADEELKPRERDLPKVTLQAVAQLGLENRLPHLLSPSCFALRSLNSIQNGKEQSGLFGILSLDSGKHPQTACTLLRVLTMSTHIICAGCGNAHL